MSALNIGESPAGTTPVKQPGRAGRGTRGERRRLRPPGLPWILPALVVVVGVTYYSIGYTGFISRLDWDGTAPNPDSVGWANYVEAFHDPVFWTAMRHTVTFLVVTFVVQTALGLILAVLLHSQVKLRTLYKVAIFIPVVLAPAIMAPVFRQVFAEDGQFNWLLDHLGLGVLSQPWLAQTSTALPVIMAVTIWQWTGLNFILYFAAVAQIDREILEAARLDGAGNFRMLWRIIWPSVRGTTLSIVVLSVIGALKTFDVPYLIARGGPNYATEFLGTQIYRETIPQARVGYGAALSMLLLIMAIVTSVIVSRRGTRETRERNQRV
jgi:ABC-type sugar transport system permease subunit